MASSVQKNKKEKIFNLTPAHKKSTGCRILASTSGSLVHSMHLLTAEIEKKIDAELTKKQGITLSQFTVLVGLFGESEPLSQVKLAEKLKITEATMSRHIKILTAKNILTRSKEVSNKKAYTLSLTKNGADIFSATEQLIISHIENITSVLSDKEKKEMLYSVSKILMHVQKK